MCLTTALVVQYWNLDAQAPNLAMEEPRDALMTTEASKPEDWDEDEDYDEDDDDEDIDKEAQEIARRLGAELWADISKATAERNSSTTAGTATTGDAHDAILVEASDATMDVAPSSAAVKTARTPRKEDAILSTMQVILGLVENDPQAKAALLSAAIPNGPNILDILYQCTSSGGVAKGIAAPLSQIIITLAKSEVLFGNLKQSNASAIQLDRGKRKREEFDEGHQMHPHAYKRPYVPDSDLQHQVVEAVRIIAQSLGSSPPQAIDPPLVSSIRLQLHQVFLFAVTSSTGGGPSMHALQEISGLIQVIGVLSGIQIGHSPPDAVPHPPPSAPFPHTYPWNPGQPSPMATDIGTAVYPCLVAGCQKTFSRLYSLRAHQRSHSSHRPYRCTICPASFARNHDLKRHVKLHDKTAWKCEGCQKVFSRRDAIKRHKTGTKNRGPKSEICLIAGVIEVQLEGAEAEDALREERRAKLWNGIAVNEASGVVTASASHHTYRDLRTVDEGEINPAVIAGIQSSVLTLHGLLQALVGNALGNPVGHPPPIAIDPSAGQVTLASVIARAQSQSLPLSMPVPPTSTGQTTTDQSSADLQAMDVPTDVDNSLQPRNLGENPENHQPLPSLSMYGLSDEQAQLLELAIASAASAAQAQAEAEAALEEEDEDEDEDDYDDSEMEQDKPDEGPVSATR